MLRRKLVSLLGLRRVLVGKTVVKGNKRVVEGKEVVSL